MVNAKTLPDQQKKHIYHQMEEKKQGGSRRIRSVKGQQNCFFFLFGSSAVVHPAPPSYRHTWERDRANEKKNRKKKNCNSRAVVDLNLHIFQYTKTVERIKAISENSLYYIVMGMIRSLKQM